MGNSNTVEIEFVTRGGEKIVAASDKAGESLKNLGSGAGTCTSGMNSLGLGIGSVSTLLELMPIASVAAGIGMLSSDLYSVNKEFGQLNAQLVTITGSQASADIVFARLEDFATKTPYQLDEVVTAFAKLKARGLDPSEAALTSYGNIASGMSKSLDQMIEAVGDASTGEFERLRDFGINASTQGDKVIFTFKGVSTTIAKESSAIEGYLLHIGNTDFAAGMTRQMEALGGSASNLGDDWDKLMLTIGDLGAVTAMQGGMSGMSTMIKTINADLNIGARLIAEEKLMLQQLVDEVVIRMNSGEGFKNWLTPQGREELKAELDASVQMYQHSWDEIQRRYGNFKADLSDPTEVGPPKPPPKPGPDKETLAAQKKAIADAINVQRQMDIDAINARVDAQIEADNRLQRERQAIFDQSPGLVNAFSFNPAPADDIPVQSLLSPNGLTVWDQAKLDSAIALQLLLADIHQAEVDASRQRGDDEVILQQGFQEFISDAVLRGATQRAEFEKMSANDKFSTITGDISRTTSALANSNKSMFRINQAARVLEAGQNAVAGAIATWNAYKYPWNIPMTALHVAGSAAYMSKLVGASSDGTSSAGNGSGRSPAINQVPVNGDVPAEAKPGQLITINFHGYVNATDTDGLARELSSALKKAMGDGY